MKKIIGITAAVIGGVLVLLVVIGVIVGKQPASAPAASTPAVTTVPATPAAQTTTAPAVQATTAPAATVPAPVQVTRKVIRIIFSVSGAGAPSITYGSDSDNRSPSGTLGPLGDGNPLPWHAAMAYDSSALYYDVSAQLEGNGSIACSVALRVTEYFSDGTHMSRGKVLARGHASGGYNICDAQAS